MLAIKKGISSFSDLCEYVSKFIEAKSGNVLGENQRSMVTGRIKKRLIDLGNLTPSEYYQYLQENFTTETDYLVSILTTHHTFFFREFIHFEFLEKKLDEIVKNVRARGQNKIRIYSAACSRGQEVYSLAMFFAHHLVNHPGMDYEIYGTDIDPASIIYCENGVYPFKEVIGIPKKYLSNHWLKGTGEIAAFARIKNEIKAKCKFAPKNLLELEKESFSSKFDIIFCRNVFIYFDASTIKDVCLKFKDILHSNGFLITGLSESLKPLNLDISNFAPSVYSFSKPSLKVVEKEKFSEPLRKIRVAVVDDSPVIVKLLTKMFRDDPAYELVGTAGNGLEAEKLLKEHKIDAMTLDIHMPIMDGVQYLQKNYSKDHPKVIMVSSASRDDARFAQKALELGASDFVEKPTFDNIKQIFNEIKMKMKSALTSVGNSTEFDKMFSKDHHIKNCENKFRLFIFGYGDLDKVKTFLNSLEGEQPPVILLLKDSDDMFETTVRLLQREINKIEVYTESMKFEKNSYYVASLAHDFVNIKNTIKKSKATLSILGSCPKGAIDPIASWSELHLLLDDSATYGSDLTRAARDSFPFTSFAHLGTEYLSKD